MKKVGKVTHYYGKIGVAIIELEAPLKVGDRIKFESGQNSFEQPVESMQIEHGDIQGAKKGDVIGLKAEQKVGEGTEVYFVETE